MDTICNNDVLFLAFFYLILGSGLYPFCVRQDNSDLLCLHCLIVLTCCQVKLRTSGDNLLVRLYQETHVAPIPCFSFSLITPFLQVNTLMTQVCLVVLCILHCAVFC